MIWNDPALRKKGKPGYEWPVDLNEFFNSSSGGVSKHTYAATVTEIGMPVAIIISNQGFDPGETSTSLARDIFEAALENIVNENPDKIKPYGVCNLKIVQGAIPGYGITLDFYSPADGQEEVKALYSFYRQGDNTWAMSSEFEKSGSKCITTFGDSFVAANGLWKNNWALVAVYE